MDKLLTASVLFGTLWTADGHGRLIEPPSRSSMWRFGFNNTVNYNDNALFCGGKSVSCNLCSIDIRGSSGCASTGVFLLLRS